MFDKYVFTGGADARVKKWDLASCRPMFTYLGHRQKIHKILVTEDIMFSTAGDGTAKVWLNNKAVMTLKGHQAGVWCAVIMNSLSLMITGSADATIKAKLPFSGKPMSPVYLL